MNEREASAVARHRPEPSALRRLATPLVVGACRFLMQGLNRVDASNLEAFRQGHAADRPLLTFSNHVSLFDDPWLVATFAPWTWDDNRWCATDALNFFSNPLTGRFFSFGRGVPIVRGAGLDQPGFDFLLERLKAGDWVHIFPEGGRSRNPEKLKLPLKGGLGHLVAETKPLVLPFHHTGMEKVLPIGNRLPRFGNHIRLVFGDLLDSAEGLAAMEPGRITDWAQTQLLDLEAGAVRHP